MAQPYHSSSNIETRNPLHTVDQWNLAEDFDLGALDSALNANLYQWVQPSSWQSTHHMQALPTMQQQKTAHHLGPCDLESHSESALAEHDEMQVQIDPSSQSQSTQREQAFPVYQGIRSNGEERGAGNLRDSSSRAFNRAAPERPAESLTVDRQYRDTLSNRLCPQQYEKTHLSVDHLNLCLRLYLKRFHPIYPVVHMSSFRPNSRNALLLLSMCSIGSLFIGTTEAVDQGHDIFRRLHKAILASWESHLSASKGEALCLVQAALLGQAFGTLSRRSTDLTLTDAFHGTVVAWARSIGAFENKDRDLVTENLSRDELPAAWREWIFREQTRSQVTSDALFDAPNSEAWYGVLKDVHRVSTNLQPIKVMQWMVQDQENTMTLLLRMSSFTAYSILANLNACVIESRACMETESTESKLIAALVQWYNTYPPNIVPDAVDTFQLLVLWHSSFITLSINPIIFEQALGRDGDTIARSAVEKLHQWSTSSSHLRCLFHACMLLERVESIGLRATPAMHVPQALYYASIALLCHALFLQPRHQLHPQWREEVMKFPEVHALSQLNANRIKKVTEAFPERLGQDKFDMAYDFVDLLRKLDRWGIAEHFAEIIMKAVRVR
ncbi:unnamed protein product [Penicillium bialowiezense]